MSRTASLGDLITLDKGISYSGKYLTRSGTPMVNLKCIARGGGFRPEGTKPYSGPYKDRHRVIGGDIVIANTDLTQAGEIIGSPAIVPPSIPEGVFSHHLFAVRIATQDVHKVYLYYRLRGPDFKAHVRGRASGTTVLAVHADDVLDFRFDLPSLPMQQKIAGVLAAYDELIENNLRRIEILEEMAQAVYREWFVNFRYPGHETDQLVDSSVGPIPKGWEVTRLGDRLEFAYGKALKEQDRRGGNVAVYGSSGVVGWHDRALVEGPGIVVGRKGNVGAVHWSDGDFYPIDTTFFVRTDLPLEYVFRNLRDQNFINSDAAVPGLNREQAYGNPLLVPGSDVLERYETVVKPLTALRRNLEQQNVNLRATRELLLPKLVSGELDVSELDIDTSWLTL